MTYTMIFVIEASESASKGGGTMQMSSGQAADKGLRVSVSETCLCSP